MTDNLMTDNLNVKATKAVDDSRMVGQAVYPGAKGAARNMHNIVATSIHQVKDANVAARKVSDDAKAAVHKDDSGDAKVSHSTLEDAGMKAPNVSGDAKSSIHKADSGDAKVSHSTLKDAGMKAPNVSGNRKSGVHKAGEGA